MSRTDWLEARRTGIGGTDAAAILGLSRFSNKMQVYFDKTGPLTISGDGEVRVGGTREAAYWGLALEDEVARAWSGLTGKRVRRRNGIVRKPDEPWMFASLDRVVVREDALLEVKTTSAYTADRWADGAIPPEYFAQVQHYLYVTGFSTAYIAALVGGQRLERRTVGRDEEWMASAVAACRTFWHDHVVPRIPPDFADFTPTPEALALRFRPEDADPEEIALTGEAERWLAVYAEAKAAAAAAAETVEAAECEIKALLGDHEAGRAGRYRVTWKWSKPARSVDTAALKADGLYEKYARERTPARRFTVKEVEGDE